MKFNYEIALYGCHEDTYIDFMLSDKEYELLKKISEKTIEASKSGCMPKLNITLINNKKRQNE